jgi:hypothetical protein
MLCRGVKPSGAHAVGAVFVFLHLLEANPEGVGKLILRLANLTTTLADTPAHMVVYIRSSPFHCAACPFHLIDLD